MTDPVQQFVDGAKSVVATVKTDVQKIEATIAADFSYLKHEAAVIFQWAESSHVLKPILDAGLKDAEAAAAALATAAEGYLTGAVSNMAADAETFVANLFQAAGISKANLPADMTGAAGNSIAYLEALAIKAIQTAVPKVLAAILAPAS